MANISEYKLVVGKDPTYNERRAAFFMIEKIKAVTGYNIPVTTDSDPVSEYEIIVGETEREKDLGVSFDRSRDKLFEYEIRYSDKKLFVTGLGISEEIFREPYGAYAPVKDYGIGTLYAAMRFCEKVLGYEFIYVSDIDALTDRDAEEIEINESCSLLVSAEKLLAERPEKFEGAALYSIPGTSSFDLTRSCLIFKTSDSEFIVYDGGKRQDAEHLVDILEYLADGKRPRVKAWLISQLRSAHSGALCEICQDQDLNKRVDILDVYCRLMSIEFYTEIGASKGEDIDALKTDYEVIKNIQEHIGAELHIPNEEDRIAVGDFTVDVIRAPKDSLCECEKVNNNDSSVVYKVTYRDEQSMLLLGDGEKYTARELDKKIDSESLKSDILLIGHHGRASISQKCFDAIGADIYIAQTTNKIWYSDESSSARVPVYRVRRYIRELGKKRENVYRDTEGILSFSLPVAVKQEV